MSTAPFRYRTGDKSPLHPSALRLNDLNPGRTIVQFNRVFGQIGTYTVVSRPFVGYLGTPDGKTPSYSNQTKKIVIMLRSKWGSTWAHALGDMGILPYETTDSFVFWNDFAFTVDARKAHLLPEPDDELAAQLNEENEEFALLGEFYPEA